MSTIKMKMLPYALAALGALGTGATVYKIMEHSTAPVGYDWIKPVSEVSGVGGLGALGAMTGYAFGRTAQEKAKQKNE